MGSEQDKKEYLELIERVRKVSSTAARYMEKEARELPTFYPSCSLASAFAWDETEYGHGFWDEIDEMIRKDQP